MFVSLITGHFWDYVVFTSIIIVHEFGHIFSGVLFSWKINRIVVLPFGGLTVFDVLINTSLIEQLIVTLMGPLFQVVYIFILNYFFSLNSIVLYYNFVLLFFNLLPIYPMDGSKILYVFLCFLFPFKYSHILYLIVSFLFIFLLFLFFRFNLILYLILVFLIVKCFKEFINHKNVFNRFLLERYIYDFRFKHVRFINSVNGMYLWCRHVFKKSVSERDFLLKMFDK
jgi:stage IV sporulation protein FB